MRLKVGLTAINGSIEEYAKRFDVLELRADPKRLPSDKALRRLRSTAGDSVDFALLVPAELAGRALENADEIAPMLATAEAIGPKWIVIQTGHSVGSSQRTRGRLQSLVERLAHSGRHIGWEPRGPFEPELARGWSRELGIVLVEDLSRVDDAEPGPLVYTRLRAEGSGARLAGSALERLGEQLAGSEEAWVVIEGRPSAKARARVRRAIQRQVGLEADELEAEELEDGANDEEDEEFEGSDEDGERFE
jgi:uncharacterized protein YecE (DUF72 family)